MKIFEIICLIVIIIVYIICLIEALFSIGIFIFWFMAANDMIGENGKFANIIIGVIAVIMILIGAILIVDAYNHVK